LKLFSSAEKVPMPSVQDAAEHIEELKGSVDPAKTDLARRL